MRNALRPDGERPLLPADGQDRQRAALQRKGRMAWDLSENLSLGKSGRFSEDVRLDIRAESFNIFNRVKFTPGTSATEVANLQDPHFGVDLEHSAPDAIRRKDLLLDTTGKLIEGDRFVRPPFHEEIHF
jgi:hypothetical protein